MVELGSPSHEKDVLPKFSSGCFIGRGDFSAGYLVGRSLVGE